MTDKLAVLENPGSLSPSPVFRGAEMMQALTEYRALQKALDQSMPDQLMRLDGKPFRKKGYWRAVAVAFNLTVEPVTETRSVVGALEDGSENYVYSMTYRASTQSGRSAVGDGACAAAEKSKGRLKPSEHNVRSHASTRAFNRAVSNLVGFGEVSAEEVSSDEHRSDDIVTVVPKRDDGHQCPAGATHIIDVTSQTGTKNGRDWKRYDVKLADGRSCSTFSEDVAGFAEAAVTQDRCVKVDIEQKGKYSTLTWIRSATEDPIEAKNESDEPPF